MAQKRRGERTNGTKGEKSGNLGKIVSMDLHMQLQVTEHALVKIHPTLTCMHQHVFTYTFPQALCV